MKSTDLMREEIKAQSKLFTGYAPALYEKAVTLLKEELNSPVERIYITGCGDSFFAGMEFQDLFYEWTGVEAFAVHALEFSRYVCPKHVNGKTLVLSISASGKVTRTIEAAARAKEAGGHSIAITSNAETPLAKAAGRSLEVTIPNNISLAPGVRSYAASQVSLICLALGLSKVKGTLDDEKIGKILSLLAKTGEAIEKTAEIASGYAQAYVNRYFGPKSGENVRIYHVLGSGSNLGTANFGTMKLLESCGFSSVPCDLEEWAHSHYFAGDKNTHVIVLGAKGRSHFRAKEILSSIPVVDAKTVMIAEENDKDLTAGQDIVLPVCGMDDIPEWLSPVLYSIPLEILSMYISIALDREGLDFVKRPWLKEENFRQIYHSDFRLMKEDDL